MKIHIFIAQTSKSVCNHLEFSLSYDWILGVLSIIT